MAEGLLEKLKKYSESDFYPLHMPGHKRRLSHFKNPFQIDITEIEGFDNLHHAEGVLQEAQERAARLYGSEESFYLVNGSTCGILAAVAAQTKRGSRILMARNCHKAVYHAVFLNGLRASYLYPEMDVVRGINGAIRPGQVREALERYPDIRTVLITSPTYDGVVSDIRQIADIVHRAGGVLIVDEAHGAHFVMHPYFPDSAVSCGADIVINSLHKTMPSLTQTALLHVQGDRADRARLRKYLRIYQSSSPSYVLMAGMDACICLMQRQGTQLFDAFTARLETMRSDLRGLQALHLVAGTEPELQAYDFDRSKVLISTEGTCMTGPELSGILRREYHLEPEMEAAGYVTGIMTVCDTGEGFERLEKALLEIDGRLLKERVRPELVIDPVLAGRRAVQSEQSNFSSPNEAVFTMEQAEDKPAEQVALEESAGRISAEFVYVYPPGIPLLVPGERISGDLPARLEGYQAVGLRLQGLADYTGRSIRVIQEL